MDLFIEGCVGVSDTALAAPDPRLLLQAKLLLLLLREKQVSFFLLSSVITIKSNASHFKIFQGFQFHNKINTYSCCGNTMECLEDGSQIILTAKKKPNKKKLLLSIFQT